MTAEKKKKANVKAFDILLNDDEIEVKSIKDKNIPLAFQKRDKIPMDEQFMKKEANEARYSSSSLSFSSTNLSTLPYDERPIPTVCNMIKKKKEEKLLKEEKLAQLSWKKSIDEQRSISDLNSILTRASGCDKFNRSSMNIVAEVMNIEALHSSDEDSQSDYSDNDIETEISHIDDEDNDDDNNVNNNENDKKPDKDKDKDNDQSENKQFNKNDKDTNSTPVVLMMEMNDSKENNNNNNNNNKEKRESSTTLNDKSLTSIDQQPELSIKMTINKEQSTGSLEENSLLHHNKKKSKEINQKTKTKNSCCIIS